jgi:hypothetical protein
MGVEHCSIAQSEHALALSFCFGESFYQVIISLLHGTLPIRLLATTTIARR